MSTDVLRGYNDIMILYILSQEDSYGYEISKRIKHLSNELYTIKETTLYSAFNRLEKNGFIESYRGQETQGKPRTYYKITTDGHSFYQSKCSEWSKTKQIVNNFIKE